MLIPLLMAKRGYKLRILCLKRLELLLLLARSLLIDVSWILLASMLLWILFFVRCFDFSWGGRVSSSFCRKGTVDLVKELDLDWF